MKLCATVIIVSQRRPKDLEVALASLIHQSIVNFEIIVVSDRPPLVHQNLSVGVKFIECAIANISYARNLGIMSANAPIVAFLDDDSIADPLWLERLIEPFYTHSEVAATGGYVRGRNGISFQWESVGFYKNAEDFNLNNQDQDIKIYEPHSDYYVKMIGTNCAYLKQHICKIGGFDEGFHYYLDDTDISKRLQDQGLNVAIVPNAQVIHKYKQSRGRGINRVPQSLYNLGASTNLFLRKHCYDDMQVNIEKFYEDQEARLKRFFDLGLLSPKQIKKLLRDLRNGLEIGDMRQSSTPLKAVRAKKLVPMKKIEKLFEIIDHQSMPSPQFQTLFIRLKRYPTAHAAQFGFSREGYWYFKGGRFGRIIRNDGPWWRYRRRSTYKNEVQKFISETFGI